MALEGNISEFSLPEILQLLSSQRKTGVLQLGQEDDTAAFDFDEGKITGGFYRKKNLPEHLGNYLFKTGLITEGALAQAEAEQKKLEVRLRNHAIANRTPDEIVFLESRRSIYPKDPSYGVNFWRKVVRQHDWIEQEQQNMAEWRRKGEAWRAKLQAGDAVICKNRNALSGTHITP